MTSVRAERDRRDAIARHIAARICDDRRSIDELRVIDHLLHRLELGAEQYGPLDLDSDKRDFRVERAEELLDAAIYGACDELKRRDSRVGEVHAPDGNDRMRTLADAQSEWSNRTERAYADFASGVVRVIALPGDFSQLPGRSIERVESYAEALPPAPRQMRSIGARIKDIPGSEFHEFRPYQRIELAGCCCDCGNYHTAAPVPEPPSEPATCEECGAPGAELVAWDGAGDDEIAVVEIVRIDRDGWRFEIRVDLIGAMPRAGDVFVMRLGRTS